MPKRSARYRRQSAGSSRHNSALNSRASSTIVKADIKLPPRPPPVEQTNHHHNELLQFASLFGGVMDPDVPSGTPLPMPVELDPGMSGTPITMTRATPQNGTDSPASMQSPVTNNVRAGNQRDDVDVDESTPGSLSIESGDASHHMQGTGVNEDEKYDAIEPSRQATLVPRKPVVSVEDDDTVHNRHVKVCIDDDDDVDAERKKSWTHSRRGASAHRRRRMSVRNSVSDVSMEKMLSLRRKIEARQHKAARRIRKFFFVLLFVQFVSSEVARRRALRNTGAIIDPVARRSVSAVSRSTVFVPLAQYSQDYIDSMAECTLPHGDKLSTLPPMVVERIELFTRSKMVHMCNPIVKLWYRRRILRARLEDYANFKLPSVVDIARSSPFYTTWPEAVLRRMVSAGKVRIYETGEWVHLPGKNNYFLAIYLSSGTVVEIKKAEKRKHYIRGAEIAAPAMLCDERAATESEDHTGYRAVTTVVTVEFQSVAALKDLLSSHNIFQAWEHICRARKKIMSQSCAVSLSVLRGLTFFRKWEDHNLMSVVMRFEPRVFQPGQVMVAQGDPANEFFTLARGRAAFVVNGRKVGETKPGASFGEVALNIWQKDRRKATVQAIGMVDAWVLSTDHFAALLKDPSVMDSVKTALNEQRENHMANSRNVDELLRMFRRVLDPIPDVDPITNEEPKVLGLLRTICGLFTPKVYSRGDRLSERGESATRLVLLTSGKIATVSSMRTTVHAPTLFGHCFGGCKWSDTVIAVKQCECWEIEESVATSVVRRSGVASRQHLTDLLHAVPSLHVVGMAKPEGKGGEDRTAGASKTKLLGSFPNATIPVGPALLADYRCQRRIKQEREAIAREEAESRERTRVPASPKHLCAGRIPHDDVQNIVDVEPSKEALQICKTVRRRPQIELLIPGSTEALEAKKKKKKTKRRIRDGDAEKSEKDPLADPDGNPIALRLKEEIMWLQREHVQKQSKLGMRRNRSMCTSFLPPREKLVSVPHVEANSDSCVALVGEQPVSCFTPAEVALQGIPNLMSQSMSLTVSTRKPERPPAVAGTAERRVLATVTLGHKKRIGDQTPASFVRQVVEEMESKPLHNTVRVVKDEPKQQRRKRIATFSSFSAEGDNGNSEELFRATGHRKNQKIHGAPRVARDGTLYVEFKDGSTQLFAKPSVRNPTKSFGMFNAKKK